MNRLARIRKNRATTPNGAGGKANGVNHRPAAFSVAPSDPVLDGQPREPAPAPQPAEGRTTNRRFAPGNHYGKGSAFNRKLAAMRSAFLGATSEADVADVAKALLTKARGGDVEAAKLFLNYVIGKPAPAANPDTVNLDEMALILRYPASEIEQLAILEGARAPGSVAAIKEEAIQRYMAYSEGDEEE